MNRDERFPLLQIGLLLFVFAVLIVALLSASQIRLTQTFTSSDGLLSFRYPDEWIVREPIGTEKLVTLDRIQRGGEESFTFFYDTNEVLELFQPIARYEEPFDLLPPLMDAIHENSSENFVFSNFRRTTINELPVAWMSTEADLESGVRVNPMVMVLGSGERGFIIIVINTSGRGNLAYAHRVALAIASTLEQGTTIP